MVGVAAGAVVFAARRKARKDRADAELWAEATDSVARFGEA